MTKIFSYFIALLLTVMPLEKVFSAQYSIYSMPADLSGQVLIQNFQAPVIMAANNQYYLVYEIFVSNFQGEIIKLTSLKISDLDNHITLTELKNDNLAKIISIIGPAEPEKNSLIFNPGVTKVFYLWMPFTTKDAIPNKLTHSISYRANSDNKIIFSASTIIPVNKNYLLPVVGKPLHGANWVASGAPSNTTHHRTAYLITNNQVIFGERYAIDFIKTGSNGLTYAGDEFKNENYFCYGQNVIAVADGRVAKIQDGLSENIPHSDKMAIPFSMKVGPGNYVAIDIGQGNYAFYAHLIPGSITAKVGERVKKGQVIAKVGNSGHSVEPHLHFQLTNNVSLINGNSLPYAFDQFYKQNANITVLGKLTRVKVKIIDDTSQDYNNQLMLQNWLVKFD